KGDIARACFYMAACYNNFSGKESISQYDPNLIMVDYASDSGNAEESSADHPVAMGILSDMLEWNKIDPVDEFEIHRNNLIYNNYQHNRNPFVDFPQWADYIWGQPDDIGNPTAAANPATNSINAKQPDPLPTSSSSSEPPASSESSSETSSEPPVSSEPSSTSSTTASTSEPSTEFVAPALEVSQSEVHLARGESIQVKATTSDGTKITWASSDIAIASLSRELSDSGQLVTIYGKKAGKATITCSAEFASNGQSLTQFIDVFVKEEAASSSAPSSTSEPPASSSSSNNSPANPFGFLGCGGSLAGGASILSLILLESILLIKKAKKKD
ncbi:MAG: endonuclease, partial [Bacilli bacterium]|nr:endonuclease [Bacilli bacterium]